MLCRGVYLPGGVPAQGVGWGVYLPGGVPAWGVPARGYICWGREVYLPGGVPTRRMYLPRGVYPPRYSPPMNRILDTRFSKFYLWGEGCTCQGVYLTGGCTFLGTPPMDRILDTRFSKFYLWGEGCTCQGVYLTGGCTFLGTPPMDRILDTYFSKFYLAPTSLWVAKIQL